MSKPDPNAGPSVRTWTYPHTGYWKAVEQMGSRMAISEQKYGAIEDNYPAPGDALATLLGRIERYRETGNTEWLLDAANMAVIEHLRPTHPAAHFRATDTDESPGIHGLAV